MLFQSHHDHIKYDCIYHKKIPHTFNNYNIFFIADIHKRKLKKSTLEKINKPIELVLIGGDLIERGVPLERMRSNLKMLQKWKVPIYFVWGNNDRETDTDKMTEVLRGENVAILEDNVISIYKDKDKINLI